MNPEHQMRQDTQQARQYLDSPGQLARALHRLFPHPILGAVADTGLPVNLDPQNRPRVQGICRVLSGEGSLRPVTDSQACLGSGARRTRQKCASRPGHEGLRALGQP